MSMLCLKSCGLAGVLALLAVFVGAGAPHVASAQMAGCGWYADTAVKQQQQNEHKKCGLKGPEWSSNRQAHLTWCTSQPPDRWKAEAQRREQLLAGCKP
jgi:hypothetical protein